MLALRHRNDAVFSPRLQRSTCASPTRRTRHRAPPLRTTFQQAAAIVVVVAVAFAFSGCISISELYPNDTGAPTEQDGGAEGGDSTTQPGNGGGTPGDGGDGATRPDEFVSGTTAPPDDAVFFRVTEDYWVQTPWFGVSSIIVMVKWRLPQTKILIREGTILEGPMQHVDAAVRQLPADYRRERFGLTVAFHFGDVPPFVDPERYNDPENYY